MKQWIITVARSSSAHPSIQPSYAIDAATFGLPLLPPGMHWLIVTNVHHIISIGHVVRDHIPYHHIAPQHRSLVFIGVYATIHPHHFIIEVV